jgi:DNA-binding response OmpR family regulator
MMPNLDGFQFVRCVRGDTTSSQTPLVILSALASDDSRLTGILSGADAYLTKPFQKGALRSTIERVLAMTPEERAQRVLALANAADGAALGAADMAGDARVAREGRGVPGAAGAGGQMELDGDSA